MFDSLTILVLAGFGFLGLLITSLTGLLRQLPELFQAFNEARRAMRRRHEDDSPE